MKKYIIREVPAGQLNLGWYFDEDTFSERSGDFCSTLFILRTVVKPGWSILLLEGINIDTWVKVRHDAIVLFKMFEDVGHGKGTYKEAMEHLGISYSPWKCEAIKTWAETFYPFRDSVVAEYLTIITGKIWETTRVHGHSLDDYVDIIYCEECYDNVRQHGEVYLGCAKEFTVINFDPEDNEADAIGSFFVADCLVQKSEDCKRIVCEWAGIPEEETELLMLDGAELRNTGDVFLY